ncbi:signal peptide peptidase SppA [Thiohalorhabdus sp.]|uniref:signal peptide peptidase SppA n=1 Tax=Thiohalorhabdus sp. TaxID=3094134 RepID=UPI002FC2FC89
MRTEQDPVPRSSGYNRKAAWLTGGLLFLIASGMVGLLTGGDQGVVAGQPHLARVEIEGPILQAEPLVRLLEEARKREATKGVLLRVDSPGGGVGASQALYEAVERLSTEKPVAVSLGSMGASGGYMAALGGDRLFALDSTLAGSIGVIMMSSGVYPLLEDVGIEPRIIKSGKLKDAGTPLREMTGADRAYLQSLVDELHDHFVTMVAEERDLTESEVRELADGRLFSGRQAAANGLVDAVGGKAAAEAWLREEAGVSSGAPIEELEPPREWLDSLLPLGMVRWTGWLMAPEPRFRYQHSGAVAR